MSHIDNRLLGRNLQRIRKMRGLTQFQVASMLEVRPVTISDYERGRVNLSLERGFQLAKIYQCSLDKLIGMKICGHEIEGKTQEVKVNRLSLLVNLGLFSDRFDNIQNSMKTDPVIMVHLGLNEVNKKRGFFHEVLSSLTDIQKKEFTIELLKYLNSLMSIDVDSDKEDLLFLEFIKNELPFKLIDSELDSIKRAASKRYFGGGLRRYFPNDALRRITIWIMCVFGKRYEVIGPTEIIYIWEVAKHFGISEETVRFIEEKIIQASHEN